MTFIKSTIFNLLFYAWTLLVCILFLPTLIMPLRITIIAGKIWASGLVILLRLICGIKIKALGLENLPKGKCIIACKHQSAWETFIFYRYCTAPAYVLKKEIKYLPLFGWYIWAIKTISVNRKGGASALRDMLRQVQDRVDNERQVIIFPEGTRVKAGEVGKYQAGIAAIYSKIDADIIPVALNSGHCWGRNSWVKKSGVITIKFLPKIKRGLKKSEFMNELEEVIESGCKKL